jgi:hypothetical protein
MLIGIAVGVGAFVLWPLIFGAPETADGATLSSKTVLEAQRERVLDELRALDFDHQTGKVLDEDWRQQRARLVARGAEILREIDALPQPAAPKKRKRSG